MKITVVSGHGRQRPTCQVIQQSTHWGAKDRLRKGLDPNICAAPGSYMVGTIVMCRRHAADWALRGVLDGPA